MNTNRYIIVTGAGGSIGSAITRSLAHEGHNVIMACRNVAKDTPLCQEIDKEYPGTVTIMQLDLASLDSIKSFADNIKDKGYAIEALINNAGVMNKEYRTTHEGYEMTIGVNFLGTYLLTELLLPTIVDGGSITFTTSLTRYIGTVDEHFFDLTADNYGRFRAYSRSKLATTLYTAHLAQKLSARNIHVNAADPGVVDTGMIRMDAWFDPLADKLFRPIISTPRQGALSALTAYRTPCSGEIFEKTRHHAIPKRLRQHRYTSWLIAEAERLTTQWR